MKMRQIISSVSVVLLLAGCSAGSGQSEISEPEQESTNSESSNENSESTDKSEFAIATVKERFESDCFSALGSDTSYRYEPDSEGMREGYVYASVGGSVLKFSVGVNTNTGAFLTIPDNDSTIELLESVGC